jgi:hypothetical protein
VIPIKGHDRVTDWRKILANVTHRQPPRAGRTVESSNRGDIRAYERGRPFNVQRECHRDRHQLPACRTNRLRGKRQ